MVKTKSVQIKNIIGTEQEIEVINAINNFSCRDKEVETFLKDKAFEFDRRHKSRTYIIINAETPEDEQLEILAYFTLTMKTLPFNESLSKSKIKRIDGFSKDIGATEAILIGQLGKNSNCPNLISGKEIITFALDIIYGIHSLVGGRIVFLECQNHPKIIKFYQDNEFDILQKSEGLNYIQMVRFL